MHNLLKPHPLYDYKLTILPPNTKGELWFGYATHEDYECDEETKSAGATAAQCAKNLERAVIAYHKGLNQ